MKPRHRELGLLIKMELITNESKTRKIDQSLHKNKWRNDWMNLVDDLNRPFRKWLRKTSAVGSACLVCSKKIFFLSIAQIFCSHPWNCNICKFVCMRFQSKNPKFQGNFCFGWGSMS
eukprot:GHVL01004931.1.p1 GENE.GHVL01004931.1~~GHVL01004931.1.p1  ORF type:complete len:117 (-),score=6.09 GHVL01004931.1:280-630(-)